MAGHYEVIFSGEIYAAVDPVKVRSDMARIFRQPAEKVHRLFDGRTWVLKDGLDRATAERYQVELAKIGVISEVRDRAPKYEAEKVVDQHAQSQNFTLEKVAIAKMKCPDCGYEQLEADYCARCGVSIAVARAKAKVRAPAPSAVAEDCSSASSSCAIVEGAVARECKSRPCPMPQDGMAWSRRQRPNSFARLLARGPLPWPGLWGARDPCGDRRFARPAGDHCPQFLKRASVVGCLAPVLAQILDDAGPALRLAGRAHVAAMKDQPVVGILQIGIRDQAQ